MDKEIARIFRVYDKYVEALEDENHIMIGLAYNHGWRSGQVEFGKRCRKQIKALKKSWEYKEAKDEL